MADTLAAENASVLRELIAEAEEYLRHRPPVEPDTPAKAEQYWATHPEVFHAFQTLRKVWGLPPLLATIDRNVESV
jgi:hypothetical protein